MKAAQILQQAQQIKQQYASQGQPLDEAVISQQFVLPQFESNYAELTATLLNEHNIEEHELEDASLYYYRHNNSKIKEIMNKIRKIYQQCGGITEEEEEIEEFSSSTKEKREISFEKILEIIKILTTLMSERLDGYMMTFKEKYGIPTDQAMAESFYSGMMSLSEE